MSAAKLNPNSSLSAFGNAGKKAKGMLEQQKKKTGFQAKEEKMPHEVAGRDLSNLSEAKTQELYQWYCEI